MNIFNTLSPACPLSPYVPFLGTFSNLVIDISINFYFERLKSFAEQWHNLTIMIRL